MVSMELNTLQVKNSSNVLELYINDELIFTASGKGDFDYKLNLSENGTISMERSQFSHMLNQNQIYDLKDKAQISKIRVTAQSNSEEFLSSYSYSDLYCMYSNLKMEHEGYKNLVSQADEINYKAQGQFRVRLEELEKFLHILSYEMHIRSRTVFPELSQFA